jgi:hypothetical protein
MFHSTGMAMLNVRHNTGMPVSRVFQHNISLYHSKLSRVCANSMKQGPVYEGDSSQIFRLLWDQKFFNRVLKDSPLKSTVNQFNHSTVLYHIYLGLLNIILHENLNYSKRSFFPF